MATKTQSKSDCVVVMNNGWQIRCNEDDIEVGEVIKVRGIVLYDVLMITTPNWEVWC